MMTIDVGVRLGDAIDPFHLVNGFEAVIGYECQERSNHPFSHSYDAYKYMQGVTKQVSGWGGSLQCRRGILVLCLVILWMSLFGETFHAYPRLIRWTFPQFIINVSYARARAHREVASNGPVWGLRDAPEYKLIYCIQGHHQLGTMHVYGHLVRAYAVYRAF